MAFLRPDDFGLVSRASQVEIERSRDSLATCRTVGGFKASLPLYGQVEPTYSIFQVNEVQG